ncbi:hypothetical protein AVEN_58849-1 [Araneus ventricosus]|uniref:Integrase zinc-binding domain-containing protein n=1 Tax=Araneus ventricosus TaxID=182803 RepID=A0A4Y2NWN2_ARAVE|nr:hypothetical protein AVEN_58849-1 [Araneus ventricosus]
MGEWHQPVSAERNKQKNHASSDSQNRGWLVDAVIAPSRGGEHSLNVNAPDFVQGSNLTFMSNNCNKQHSALLSTAVCHLIDESGKQIRLRCLLDAGSQMSFLKRDCVEMLGLKKEKTNILVSGLNDSSIPIKSQLTAMITNENKSYVRSLNFLAVPKITAGLTPSNKFDVSIGSFSNIKLADEKFNVPERVDMLLGVEVFYELFRPGQISVPNSNLLLQNTVFGFIVSGGIPRENENVIHCGFLKHEINLDQTLKQFWEIENIESDIPKSRESILCEEHFQNNHSRDKSGRYIVKIPLKENPDCLEETKTLGLVWKSKTDCFCFKVASEEFGLTKRLVLSTIACVFDPIGILGPVVTKAKIFLQKIWLLNLKWDDPLPAKDADEWLQFSSALQNVIDIEVDRCILLPKPDLIEIHGFADASEAAYGAAVYCKSRSRSGEVSIKLIASKSRVSPIKRLTIPKLELCSAVLLAKVSEIQKLTNVDQWRHVSSHDNPADLISRGVDPDRLSESSLWWSGPEFLTHDSYPKRDIPSTVIQNDFSDELKNSNCCDSKCFSVFSDGVNNFANGLIDLSNNYCKIIRILGYIYRFIYNCKNKNERKKGPLESGELKLSELFVLKQVQNEHFVKDVNSLRIKVEVSKESQLRNLHPFLDTSGLVRVGGRLGNSELSTDRKYPILLPSKGRITHLILQYYHRMNLHVEPQSLLFHVRQKYWLLNGRTLCREIVHKCVTCFKAKPVVCEQLMGALPKERVTANFPFNCTGVDFTGPISIKYKKTT